ncbi:unnamed protein product [Allacma fusca]|uniref:Dynactin subunit 1 n=1 Tax=Allacma fusca TaxID=39272 RepID=A0A8J2MB22_9HEXA|nr:unnamed protein product [Allacma fusca]
MLYQRSPVYRRTGDARMAEVHVEIGNRVEVTGKGVKGAVAFVGSTEFASGKWVGVILDDPKGKNNGTIQGKSYFDCAENHGMFIRPNQIILLDSDGNKKTPGKPGSPSSSGASSSPDVNKPKSRLRIRIQKFSTPSLSKSPLKPMSQAQRRNQLTRCLTQIPPRRNFPRKSWSQADLSSKESKSSFGGFPRSEFKITDSASNDLNVLTSLSSRDSNNAMKEVEEMGCQSSERDFKLDEAKNVLSENNDKLGKLSFKTKILKPSEFRVPDKPTRKGNQGLVPAAVSASLVELRTEQAREESTPSSKSPFRITTSTSSIFKTPLKSFLRRGPRNTSSPGASFPVTSATPNVFKIPVTPSPQPPKTKTNLYIKHHKTSRNSLGSKLPYGMAKAPSPVPSRIKGRNSFSSVDDKIAMLSPELKLDSNLTSSFMESPFQSTVAGFLHKTAPAKPPRNSLRKTSFNSPFSPSCQSLNLTSSITKEGKISNIGSEQETYQVQTVKTCDGNRKETKDDDINTNGESTEIASCESQEEVSSPGKYARRFAIASSRSVSRDVTGRGSRRSVVASPCAEGDETSPFRNKYLKRFMLTRHVTRNFVPNSELVGLPVAGARGEPINLGRKSLQSTPSGSRSNLAGGKGDLSKRSSFVETGFVEAIVPQYTPGTPSSVLNTPVSTPAMSSAEDRFSALQANEALRYEVKDLNEKLEALKAKRAADQEKLREADRLRIQVESLSEFKAKVLESQTSLQKDLQKAKQDARDAIEAKEQHADEMSDLSEAVEMATLDKEMAEEKAETLQLELEQSQEKIAELQTELNAFKDEVSGKINPETGEVTTKLVKQLQDDNSRLKEALVKLRDASAHEKHNHSKTQKEAESFKAELVELQRCKERFETRCMDLEAQITDLHEQNDAALGAEEMVEQLTEKNLNLEEKVAQLTEAVQDLEALQDINEQLQESSKELEMELRDDLQQSQAINKNILRDREAIVETLADREATILKFREVVQQLRDDNVLLRRTLDEESSKSIPGLAEALAFKEVFAETKAQTTAIDLEIRRLEAREAALHVQYLSSFMPEGFMKRGGDNDALLVLLLVPRLVCKVELLLVQVREKLIPSNLADGVPSGDAVASSPDVERYAFSSQLCFLLYSLLSELHRWVSALNSCTADNFLKIGVLLPELAVQEKAVDFYLELLRKSQLDENIPLEGLEKCIMSFQNFYAVHLFDEQVDPSTLIGDLCLASAAASDCIIVDVNRLIYMLRSEKESNVAILLQDVKTIGESVRQLAKRTRRYLPDPPKQPPVSNKLQSQLLNDCVTLAKVVKILQEACKQAVRHSGSLSGTEGVSSNKLEEFLQASMEKCDSRAEGTGGIKEVVKEWLTASLMTMTDLAQVINEAPVMPKEKPPPPLMIRSQAVKAELDQTRNLKIQLEDKESSIKELRKALRTKQEELSEASIRKELAEKKLSNVTKDHEMSIEKLTRKLEDATSMLHRKEREFEATLEHFQTDIESLEMEKGELRDKLMSATKRTLLDGLVKSAATTPLQSPGHAPPANTQGQPVLASAPSGPASCGLIEYTRYLQRQNWKLKSEKTAKALKKLPPLKNSNKDTENLKSLDKEFWILKREWIAILGETVKLNYDTTLSKTRKEYYIGLNEIKKKQLMEKMAILKEKINLELAERKSDYVIKADFTSFSKDTSSKENKDSVKVAALKFPGWEKSQEPPKRIVLSEEQIQHLHHILTPFN